MDSDRNDLYKRLLDKGTSESEIDRVYKQLRSKGYGEEVARARVEKAVQRVREENRRARKRKKQDDASLDESEGETSDDTGQSDSGGAGGPAPGDAGSGGSAAVDTGRGGAAAGGSSADSPSGTAPAAGTRQGAVSPQAQTREEQDEREEVGRPYYRSPSPALRRKINAWAFREHLLITGVRERIRDWLTLAAPNLPDYANKRLIHRIAGTVRFDAQNPYDYSLYETLWALKSAAALMLGAQNRLSLPGPRVDTVPHSEVVATLRRREPFLLAFLTSFLELPTDDLEALRFFTQSYDAGRPVRARELSEAARLVTRLQLATEQVTDATLTELFQLSEDVLLAYGDIESREIKRAQELFIATRHGLADFARELYPVVLRALNAFYAPGDASREKRARLLGYCRLREEDLLSLSAFRNRQIREKEQELLDNQRREVEQLEGEKEEALQDRYEGVFGILEALFPGAGWDRIEQRPYLLPYFDLRVFNRQLPFPQRNPSIQAVAREDPLQLVLVVHRILDNLLSSLNGVSLEHILSKNDIADRLEELRREWKQIYLDLFEPYLKAITELQRSRVEGGASNASYARSLQEQVNQLRNRTIRDYGHTVLSGRAAESPPLYETADALVEFLEEIGTEVNVDLIQRDDPLGKRMYRQLGDYPIIDFDANANPSSNDCKPVIRQLKRYVEAKYQSRLHGIPMLAQLFYLDFFRGVADFYAYLLTDERSPVRSAGGEVPVADDEESRQWQRELDTRQRDTLELVHTRLKEEREAGLRDGLTGLRNKDFYLQKLPELYAKLQSRRRSVSLILIDVDHFKWINDTYGHPKGDEVLIDVAQTVADTVRKGHDLPIRYGGEELLVVVQADAHTALLLAERLRYVQEKHVRENELYAQIRELSEQEGAPCGTFSIGVRECVPGQSLHEAISETDKALYKAKESRNSAVLARAPASKSTQELTFIPYRSYAGKTKRNEADAGTPTSE